MADIHWSHSIHHDGSLCYVFASGPISLGSTVTLRVRTGLDAPVESILFAPTRMASSTWLRCG